MALWLLMLLEVVILLVLARIYIRYNQLQVPVRFSEFSETLYFREQWLYLLNFVGFGLVGFVLNWLASLKLLEIKGRHFALGYLWVAIIVLAVSTLLIAAVLRVAGIQ